MNIYEMLVNRALNGGGGGGSGDFSTAEVTLVKGDSDIEVKIPYASQEDSMAKTSIELTGTTTVTAILYKGVGEAWSGASDVVEVEGSATIDDGVAFITGDCTVTFE